MQGPSAELQKIVVVAGVLQRGNAAETLVVRRSTGENSGDWEFPGGKQESGESLRACLHRELKEELSIDACAGRYIGYSEYFAVARLIELHAFLVVEWSGELVLSVHDECQWLQPECLHQLNWSPADVPLVEKVNRLCAAVAVQ